MSKLWPPDEFASSGRLPRSVHRYFSAHLSNLEREGQVQVIGHEQDDVLTPNGLESRREDFDKVAVRRGVRAIRNVTGDGGSEVLSIDERTEDESQKKLPQTVPPAHSA